jgi:hypothetical protein
MDAPCCEAFEGHAPIDIPPSRRFDETEFAGLNEFGPVHVPRQRPCYPCRYLTDEWQAAAVKGRQDPRSISIHFPAPALFPANRSSTRCPLSLAPLLTGRPPVGSL